MAEKGYTDLYAIEGITGSLTEAQQKRARALMEAAETFLDKEIGRGWLEGTQTQEAHFYPAQYLSLDYWPVSSVTTVYGRDGIGEAEDTLTVDVDYEAFDLAAGIIRLVYPGSYDRIRVTYVPVDTVPADVAQACAELVANWMQPTLQPGTYGLDSYSLPDLTVRFSRAHVQAGAPPTVQAVIDRYSEPVHC